MKYNIGMENWEGRCCAPSVLEPVTVGGKTRESKNHIQMWLSGDTEAADAHLFPKDDGGDTGDVGNLEAESFSLSVLTSTDCL